MGADSSTGGGSQRSRAPRAAHDCCRQANSAHGKPALRLRDRDCGEFVKKLSSVSRRELLTVVVLFGSLLLTFLTVLQAQTIDSQRTLIRQLFQDSLELNALKMQNLQKGHLAQHR